MFTLYEPQINMETKSSAWQSEETKQKLAKFSAICAGLEKKKKYYAKYNDQDAIKRTDEKIKLVKITMNKINKINNQR